MSSSFHQLSSDATPRAAPAAYSLRRHILVVDDNCFARQALTEIFNQETDFVFCGEAANGHA